VRFRPCFLGASGVGGEEEEEKGGGFLLFPEKRRGERRRKASGSSNKRGKRRKEENSSSFLLFFPSHPCGKFPTSVSVSIQLTTRPALNYEFVHPIFSLLLSGSSRGFSLSSLLLFVTGHPLGGGGLSSPPRQEGREEPRLFSSHRYAAWQHRGRQR